MDLALFLKKTRFYFCLLLAGMFSFHAANAEFSKARYNRFNYHIYRWQVFPTSAYYSYFPKGYDSLASFASLHLSDIIEEVKTATDGALQQPPNIIIYPSRTQS